MVRFRIGACHMFEQTPDQSCAKDVPNTVPPPPAVSHLRPDFRSAYLHTVGQLTGLSAAIALSASGITWLWIIGQLLLSLVFVHAFVLLHEAGHNTLSPDRRFNRAVGHTAGFISGFPFWSWQKIHARHHKYTGWQDLDATTQSLVPRKMHPLERITVNLAWATGFPLFALLYRIQNFWNFPRIEQFITKPQDLGLIRRNLVGLSISYAVLIAWLGIGRVLELCGLGFFLGLVIQEALILSQHTHVPQMLSGGATVRPFTPAEQESFTRSLILPSWLSITLMHFDAHGLHHIYPWVPGYLLRRIAYEPSNEVHWWRWLVTIKRIRGVAFLFQNRNQSGLRL